MDFYRKRERSGSQALLTGGGHGLSSLDIMKANPMDAAAPQRVTVTYEGRVQGVGFRYTTAAAAMQFAVAGFVRNEWDGSVILVAEGRPDEVRRFLAAMRESRLGRYVTREDQAWSPATGEFTGFDIRH